MLSIVVCPKRVIYRDGLSEGEAVLSKTKCYLRCLSVWSVRSHSGLSLSHCGGSRQQLLARRMRQRSKALLIRR